MAGVNQFTRINEEKYPTDKSLTHSHSKTSNKLLLRRSSSEKLIDSTLSAEGLSNFSRKTSIEMEKTLDSEDYIENVNNSFKSLTFEPLNEEGESYLKECFSLPPIGDLSPTKCYINPHPTESEMSSSVNSANEWWYQVDYDDLDILSSRPAKGHSKQKESKREDFVKQRSFFLTNKTIREYKEREKKREEEYRAQIISGLEKQMVSLYNLKQQYKRIIHVEGCQKDHLSMSPTAAGDQLTRHRDSLVTKIKRKKVEDELRRKRQIDRKLDIIKKLMEEQRRKQLLKEIPFETGEQRKIPRREKVKLTLELLETSLEIENHVEELGKERKETDTVKVREETEPIADVMLEKVEPDVGNVPDEYQVVGSVTQESSRKRSSSKKDKKNKSPENLEKKSEKPNKKKKKKISAESEAPAATCEEKLELPTSQMEDLALWFENWREIQDEHNRFLKDVESKKLPLENDVVVKPSRVSFKDVWPQRLAQQLVTITNVGEAALQCRLAPLIQQTPLLKADLEGPSKARTGNCWDLTLTLEAADTVEDTTEEVRLEFCRGDGSRSQLTVVVEVLRPRAQPTLSTSCIRFGPQVFWSPSVASGQVQVSNSGSLGCVVRWSALPSASHSPHIHTDSDVESHSEMSCNATLVARDFVEDVFQSVFSVFRIAARQGMTVPPKSHITLPVQFVPAMTSDKGDVFTKFMFIFEGECVENATQELVVCGKIETSPFTVMPEVLYMGLCYTGSTIQQAQAQVSSAARHVCSVYTRVPLALAAHVTVLPRESLLQARSSVTLLVRLRLGWDWFDCSCPYLDKVNGLLSFPVLVMVPSAGCPPLELTVMAEVAPACPLTLAPAPLDLGTVNTHETVAADIQLTNHQPFVYNFAFVNLPESVLIEPGGGCGTILPQETLTLQLLYSPTLRDLDLGMACGRPGSQGETLYNLRCYTSVSLASIGQEKFQRNNRSSVPKERRVKDFASSVSSKYLVTTTATSERSEEGSEDVSHTSESASSILEPDKSKDSSLQAVSLTKEVGAGDNEDETIHDSLEISSISSGSDLTLRSNTQHLWDYYSTYQLNGQELSDERTSVGNTNSVEEERSRSYLKPDSQNGLEIEVLDVGKEETSVLVDEEKEIENKEEEEVIVDVNELQQPLIATPSEVNLKDENTDYITEREESCREPSGDQRFTSLGVRAWVTDPIVELSSPIVLLPPTPCNSYSVAHLYIRSKLQKKCGIHERNTKFRTLFEFASSDKQLIVEPKRGSLHYKQSVKVGIVFQPKLSHDEIFNKAFEMKLENMKWARIQEMLDQYYQSKAKKQLKLSRTGSVKEKNADKNKTTSENKKGTKSVAESKVSKNKKRSKGSVVSGKTKASLKSANVKKKDSGPLAEVTVDPSEVEVTEEDLISAEGWLLKYLEPETKTVRVTCLLDTDLGDGHRSLETLECHVVCATVAPTIVLSSSPCLEYGPTATGTRSKMYVTVTNISFFDACTQLSTLNPVGPFMCPAALEAPLRMKNSPLELPPEHIVKVPIVFQPTVTGEVMERFEVICGSTILQLQARGEGVTPSFSFTPDLEVFTLTCAAGKKADLAVSIANTCRAGLRFHIRQEFLKEGLSLPVTKPSPPESPGSNLKQKGKPKKEKKKKSELEFSSLTPDLVSCLENDFVDLAQDATIDPIFKIIDVDSYVDVSAEDTKTITVRFTPPQLPKSRPDSAKTLMSKGALSGKVKNNADEVQKNKSRIRSDDKTTDEIKKKERKDKAGEKKEKRSLPEQSAVKETDKGGKRFIVSKYSLTLGDDLKVKELVFIGVTKK